ncbi:MAG: DUF177 domain-containing protein [Clostridiales bacterium]|nr:DUF177 domain-containing protein [Clostridiales bacterium]
MLIDIRKLNAQKKYEGTMEFEYSAPETFIEIPFVKFAAPVKIVFDYELYEDNSLDIRGTISYVLEGQCSRCLKETRTQVEGELNAYFENRKDYEDYGYTNGIVDITQAVEDAIMASMPFALSCGEDCETISYNGESD